MSSTIEEITKLLPPEQAERFLTLMAHFKNVPDDDEILQLVEAIGILTLIWKEIPGEIKAILEGANPVTETCESVAVKLQKAVTEAIPSYEDLKQITKRLEGHELALKRTLTSRPRVNESRYDSCRPLGYVFALAVGALAAHFGRDLWISIL